MEEGEIEFEYQCNMCLDLLIEPCTTLCGHSFCKICLSQFLENNHNCPMCRKPIFQTKHTLSKSIILENIIKSKYPIKYQAGITNRIQENAPNNQIEYTIPAIHLNNIHIWSNITKNITTNQMLYYNTLSHASLSDRRIIVVPSINQTQSPILCSLCEIIQLETSDSIILLTLKGIKRFMSTSFYQERQNADSHPLFKVKGKIINDDIIDNEETKKEIFNIINRIKHLNQDILSNSPIALSKEIERQCGKCPIIPLVLEQLTQNKMEEISLYYLTIIKGDKNVKATLYECTNISERLDWYEYHHNNNMI